MSGPATGAEDKTGGDRSIGSTRFGQGEILRRQRRSTSDPPDFERLLTRSALFAQSADQGNRRKEGS